LNPSTDASALPLALKRKIPLNAVEDVQGRKSRVDVESQATGLSR